MAPIILFYIKSLLNPSFEFSKKDYWHFFPGTIYVLWNIIVAVVDNIFVKGYYLMDGQNDPDFQDWYIAAGLLSLLVYLILSIRFYNQYRSFIVQELSFADNVQFKWVRNFLIACFIYFLSTLLLNLLNVFGFEIEYTTTWWYYLLFALLFYYIAITGYAHSIEQKKKYNLDFLRYQLPLQLDYTPKEAEEAAFELVADTTIIHPKAESEIPEQWKSKVKEAIESKKMYQDPELTLTDLAIELGTNASLLSKIINRSFGMNFNDFINQYRVTAVKEKLIDPVNAHLTIMSLAYDAGFNSKATFNRAFKKHTGENPSKYQIK
jgi:AraC-like DNA-binding protein